jgi:ABC-type oligopeptide transport system substrate-binding subunit
MSALVILAACGGGDAGGKVLTIAREIPSDTVNYLTNSAANNSQIIANFSEGLMTYDKEGKLTGGLAESWDHKDNVYTFKLRDNLKWSNGTPLTAADFVFGWQMIATLPEAPYSYFMTDLKNGAEVVKREKPASELGVKALNDTTLEVTLEQDYVYILEKLAHTTFLPLNEAFYHEVGADNYGTSPDKLIASGAFVLTDYNPTAEYTLTKNPNYWNADMVSLDKVITRVIKESATQDTLYQNNELDVVEVPANLYDKYANQPGVVEIPSARLFYFFVSGETATPAPALANADFRSAIGYAIDKEIIAKNVFKDGTKPLDYLIPTNFADVNQKSYREFTAEGVDGKYKFDLDKAQEYLTKAKAVLPEDSLTFKIAYPEKEENRRVFENVQSQLEANLPGVKVSLESMPGQTYFTELAKIATPSAYSGWAPDYNDVATYFEIFTPGNSLNYSDYSNLEYVRLYEAAQAEKDVTKRAELFKQAEKILLDDGMIIPLAQRGKRYAVKDRVKGFNFNSISPEIDFRYISVDA